MRTPPGTVQGKVATGESVTFQGPPPMTRYATEGEVNIAEESGFIPNVNPAGQPKVVYVTPEAPVDSASQAENLYQIGSQNPLGATATPTHVIVGDANGITFINGGNVDGGMGTELITENRIPVITITRIKGH